MKAINSKYRTLTLAFGILVALLTLTTSSIAKDTTSVALETSTYEMEYELLKDYALDFSETTIEEETSIKVFNGNDELIAEGSAKGGEVADKNLQSLINKSDLLMDFNNTSYYKINE